MSRRVFSGSNFNSLQSKIFLTGAGLQHLHTWHQKPSTLTLVQLPKQSRAACCSEPWLALLRFSLLIKGRAIWSQHSTEKSKQEISVFTSSEIHMTNALHFFRVSSDEFEGILDYPHCLCSITHNPIVSICYTKGEHFYLLFFLLPSIPFLTV